LILISKHIVPRGFTGITLYPFIFLRSKELKKDEILVNHEKIHLQQQLELGIIFFYIIYGFEWLIKCAQYKNGYLAYRNLSFEKEAYFHESNINYLKKRKFWAFISYL